MQHNDVKREKKSKLLIYAQSQLYLYLILKILILYNLKYLNVYVFHNKLQHIEMISCFNKKIEALLKYVTPTVNKK